MIALDYIKVGDSSIIIDNPGDTGTDLPAFDVGCSRPSDWLSPSQWIEYTWCRLVAFVTPNSVNAMQQDTMGAYLVRKEPVATMYEYKDAMDQLNTGIQTIDWSDSGVTASGGYDADWFRIFETFGSVYNGEGIDLTGGPSYDVACDAQLPGGMAGGFASGVCYGMSLLENVGFTWWLQWIANIWFIVFLMFYIVKNWVNKASA
jgi:hypothetical protein